MQTEQNDYPKTSAIKAISSLLWVHRLSKDPEVEAECARMIQLLTEKYFFKTSLDQTAALECK